MSQLILTAVGNDRPGLVGELTGHLHAAGANIFDSRMVNLRGRFAVIMLFDAPDAAAIKPQPSPRRRTCRPDLQIADHGPAAPPRHPGLPFRLKTYSLDQPGLVHRVSEVLRAHGVNIEDLSARQESAAFAGDALFILEMRITVPPALPVRKLREDLEFACEKLNADLDLEPA